VNTTVFGVPLKKVLLPHAYTIAFAIRSSLNPRGTHIIKMIKKKSCSLADFLCPLFYMSKFGKL